MEMSEGLRDALAILIHYPYPNLELNCYSVFRVLMEVSKGDLSVLQSATAVETVLPLVLQEFSRATGLSPAPLTAHYSLFYDPKDGKMKKMVQKVLKSGGVLNYVLSVRVSKLLLSNSELLKWEFLRNCARRYPTDPFTESALRPIPDAYVDSNVVLSKEGALAFAMENGIGNDFAARELSQVFEMTGVDRQSSLTYSCFLIFAIRCYVSSNTGRGTTLNDKIVESCVKKMLHHFSERLTRLQQSIRIRILHPLLQVDSNERMRSLLSSDSLESLLRKALSFYSVKSMSKDTEVAYPLPPRPPDVFLDAPRAVGLFTYNGVVEAAGSLVKLWRGFGASLGAINGSSQEDVPPTPIHMAEGKEVLSGVLQNVKCTVLGGHGGYQLDWQDSVLHTVLPVLVARGDFALDSRGKGAATAKAEPYLEDIVRYGGSRSMHSLDRLSGWLRRVYGILTAVGESEELLMNPACRFACCHGLMRMGVVAMQAKGAMHARTRPNSSQAGAVTLSYSEFEELFLRCAFRSWAETGINASDESSDPQASMNGQQNTLAHTASIVYRKLCAAVNNASNDAATVPSAKWGVDFVEPFATALVSVGAQALTQSDAIDLCGFLGLEREVVERIFTDIPGPMVAPAEEASAKLQHVQPTPSSGASSTQPQQLQNPQQLKSAVSKLPSSSSRSPGRTSEAMDLLNQKDVQSRSGELLEGILKSRSSAPLTPQKRQILKTIIEGNGSPEVKSLSSMPGVPKDSAVNSDGSTTSGTGTTIDDSQTAGTPPDSPNTAQARAQRQALIPSPTRLLLDGTKEALWPVYGTYCSCGDSIDPGKLSGPNLFALLSKLGVLTDTTIMSDIGILLHQISAHTHSSSVSIAATSSSEAFESPSLSFEEFLVFLCAFAQLRFDGIISAPILNSGEISQELSSAGSQNTDIWLQNWKTFMGSSSAFRRLMEESVLPMLKKYPLLAFPEDARHRDRYSAVFSLEVLLAVESSETLLREVFDEGQEKESVSVTAILDALKNVELVPNVVNEEEVIQLIRDVIPEGQKQNMSRGVSSPRGHMRKQKMIFPQWEWVICIVSFQAVEKDLLQSGEDPSVNIRNTPSLVADVITYIATASTK